MQMTPPSPLLATYSPLRFPPCPYRSSSTLVSPYPLTFFPSFYLFLTYFSLFRASKPLPTCGNFSKSCHAMFSFPTAFLRGHHIVHYLFST